MPSLSKLEIENFGHQGVDEPELANEITVHRLEARVPTSIRMTAKTIAGNI